MKIILESRKYYNKENKWMLTEERVFCNNELIDTYLQVYNTETMEVVKNDQLDDDVWCVDWVKIDENK